MQTTTPIIRYTDELKQDLISVWERSVLATHTFLSKDDVTHYKQVVAGIDYNAFDVYCYLDEHTKLAGFIGVADAKIEMLFLTPEYIGKGIGKALLIYAMQHLHATEVDVNEQNQHAIAFYESFGFTTYQRTETDSDGKPYPILKMRLAGHQ
jgi:putative acetyltransferase